MNPDVTIRTWLLACGAQYGIREAHEYRWPDAATRNQDQYFTYQSLDGIPSQVGVETGLTANASYTVTERIMREHVQRWQIDLWRSQDGLYELEAMAIAADRNQAIRNVFDGHYCSFAGVETVKNLTTYDDERIDYHFQMICAFREFVEIDMTEVNGAVSKIDIGIFDGSGSYEITRTGINTKSEI